MSEDKSLQIDVQGENLNDFVAMLSKGGKLKQHAEHDAVRRQERQINKFTRFAEKNRFSNAILFSQGSIDLVAEDKTDTAYIHASKIPIPGGSIILAQAPLKDTLNDFYRLIWQQKVSTIVVVCNLEDKDQCHPYFMRKAGKKLTQRNRYRVRTIAVRSETKNLVNYELKIENYLEKKDAKQRVLNVIAIIGWEPDQIFDAKTIVAAIHGADALKRINPQMDNGKETPMLIHGCTGIRRTGVFALAYMFSKQILVNREINLLGVIEQVRMVRYGVLRKKKMFYFLLEVIVTLITETGQLKPGCEDHLQVQTTLKKLYNEGGAKAKKRSKSSGSVEGKSAEAASAAAADDEGDDEDDEGEHTDTKKGAPKDKTGKSKDKAKDNKSKDTKKKK